MKKLLGVLVRLALCFSVLTLVSCGGSTTDTKNDPDFPMREELVGTWDETSSDRGFVFNADGTGSASSVGSFSYELEFVEDGIEDYPEMTGWILYIVLDGSPLGWIYTVNISGDTLVTVSFEGTTNTYARQ